MDKFVIPEPIIDEMTMPARESSIPALVKFVGAHVKECGFGEKRVQEIELATEEALKNIVEFACSGRDGEIKISCVTHDSGALIINIIDNGAPFNMLLAGAFPETEDFFEPGRVPSTKLIKKAIKNIEFRRGPDTNTLVFTITPDWNR
ncbi:MAG: ATP-binding protein [Syntrophorhabdaceae bacterium]|nr:ATP-binding protein [Syntrophorhabdaceae bacterium]